MKKLVFTVLLLAIIQTLTAQENAQPAKIKEYGIGLYNLNNFSLQYRWGNEKRLFRLTGNLGMGGSFGSNNGITNRSYDTTLSGSTTSGTSKSPFGVNLGLNFSILKLKAINEKFGFLFGNIFGVSYQYGTSENNQTFTDTYSNGRVGTTNQVKKTITQDLMPFAGIVVGGYYKISPSFFVYAEISPNINYSFKTTTTDITATQTSTYLSAISTSSTSNHNVDRMNTYGISNLANSFAMLTFVYRITK